MYRRHGAPPSSRFIEGRLNDQWSAKLEYLYIGSPDTALSSPSTTSIDQRSIGNLVRVGVNYRF